MTTYISILRGINVTGKKMIKMDALKNMYEGLNFKQVQTYIQSGNVIFQHTKTEATDLEQIISDEIRKQFSFDVPVIVLDVEKLRKIINDNPYTNDKTKDISYLHVTFLSSKAEKIDLDSLKLKQAEGEDFTVTDKAVYLYCPHGYGVTKLTNTFFESKLKVSATTRNWKTTNVLLEIAERVESQK